MRYIKFKLGLLILISTLNLNAQTAKLNENIIIKFQSDREFEVDIDEDLTLEYDFYNDSISVEIYTLTRSEDVAEFITDPLKTVPRFLEMINIKIIGEVKKLNHIDSAYYQIGEYFLESENDSYPYLLLLIYDAELNALINFDIRCYKTSIDEGLSILNSIEIIKD